MSPRRSRAGAVATLALLALLPSVHAGDDPLPPPAYGVKGDPRTGSNIRPTVVSASGIPLNRRYDELTADEQRRVRNWYEAMPAGDEPPFPADGLGSLYATLQQVAARDRELGEWTFAVAIDAGGAPTAVSLLRGDPDEGTRHMATALMLLKYKPGRCAGQPCAASFPVRFRMHRRL